MALRIVSLLPAATEVVCALGAEAELVGISHECDFPASVATRPVLTRSRLDAHGTSRGIDEALRTAVGDALSIYAIDEAALATAAPDVIVTQDLCEVCAVSLDDVRTAVARLAHRERVEIVSLGPTRLADVLGDVERIGRAIGRGVEGRALAGELRERLDAIAERARAVRVRPSVVTVEWIDPIMLGGTWMPELIELAAGTPLGAAAGSPAPTVTSAELAALRPDVVLVKPCGFPLARTLAERPLIQETIVGALAAPARVYATDGNAFFNRPGPRLVESLEILAACVHPGAFADLASKHAGVINRLA
jgi:iron complex transport system substrate-binding protein